MGYFSDLAQKYIDFDYDRSYPSPEEQLLMRLDDLNYKLEELTEKDASYRGWERLTDNDIRYSIPEYFENIADVERAIELTLEDLKNKYEIDVLEECYNKEMEVDAIAEKQISLFDILGTPNGNSSNVEASQKCGAFTFYIQKHWTYERCYGMCLCCKRRCNAYDNTRRFIL